MYIFFSFCSFILGANRYLLNWQQRDTNPQQLSSKTNIQPFTKLVKWLSCVFFFFWTVLWVLICTVHLTACYYYVTYEFQSESTLCSVVCLNVKELLTCSLLQVWRLLRAVDYFCNKIHLRCLTRFWIHLWYGFRFKRNFREYPLIASITAIHSTYVSFLWKIFITQNSKTREARLMFCASIEYMRFKNKILRNPQYVPTTCLVLILLLLFAFG